MRLLVAAGAMLIICKTIMQSPCTEYWQFILSELLCIGFSGGVASLLSAQGIATSGARLTFGSL